MPAASTRSRQAPRAAHSTYDQTLLRWLQLSTYSSTSSRASISSCSAPPTLLLPRLLLPPLPPLQLAPAAASPSLPRCKYPRSCCPPIPELR
eukprot:6192747-Pleurochrysis_carterae.AAC.1